MSKVTKKVEIELHSVLVEVPIIEEVPQNIYITRHVDLFLTHKDSETLHKIFAGAQQSAAKLDHGGLINTVADAVRFLIQSVGNIQE